MRRSHLFEVLVESGSCERATAGVWWSWSRAREDGEGGRLDDGVRGGEGRLAVASLALEGCGSAGAVSIARREARGESERTRATRGGAGGRPGGFC